MWRLAAVTRHSDNGSTQALTHEECVLLKKQRGALSVTFMAGYESWRHESACNSCF
jgi:hypothetical protein